MLLRTSPVPISALGSNLGDREQTLLERGRRRCATAPGVDVVAVSALIDTEPVGFLDQPRFLNGVAALDTTLPRARRCSTCSSRSSAASGGAGRGSRPQGPRTLDLDLLLYGDAEIDEPGLRVPHPRMHERPFVLGPLAEIAPELGYPGRGAVQALLARLH